MPALIIRAFSNLQINRYRSFIRRVGYRVQLAAEYSLLGLKYPETALDPDLDRISYCYRCYIDNTLYHYDVISATLLDHFTPP